MDTAGKTFFNRSAILEDIANGVDIHFEFPVLSVGMQDALHFVLNALLEKYGREDLHETLYSALKEMVINGVKANMKHHFFLQSGYSLDSPEDLLKGYAELKEKLNERELDRFEGLAREHKLRIQLSILHSQERIITLVENNTPMMPVEDQRIREKFSKALGYDSIVEYYMDNADDIEGSGLGITMIVLMLKANSIDPHAFTVNTSNSSSTVARIEVPLARASEISRNIQN
jgi:hypothetical protein